MLNIFGRSSEATRILGRKLISLDRENMKNILDIPEEEEEEEDTETY